MHAGGAQTIEIARVHSSLVFSLYWFVSFVYSMFTWSYSDVMFRNSVENPILSLLVVIDTLLRGLKFNAMI